MNWLLLASMATSPLSPLLPTPSPLIKAFPEPHPTPLTHGANPLSPKIFLGRSSLASFYFALGSRESSIFIIDESANSFSPSHLPREQGETANVLFSSIPQSKTHKYSDYIDIKLRKAANIWHFFTTSYFKKAWHYQLIIKAVVDYVSTNSNIHIYIIRGLNRNTSKDDLSYWALQLELQRLIN